MRRSCRPHGPAGRPPRGGANAFGAAVRRSCRPHGPAGRPPRGSERLRSGRAAFIAAPSKHAAGSMRPPLQQPHSSSWPITCVSRLDAALRGEVLAQQALDATVVVRRDEVHATVRYRRHTAGAGDFDTVLVDPLRRREHRFGVAVEPVDGDVGRRARRQVAAVGQAQQLRRAGAGAAWPRRAATRARTGRAAWRWWTWGGRASRGSSPARAARRAIRPPAARPARSPPAPTRARRRQTPGCGRQRCCAW